MAKQKSYFVCTHTTAQGTVLKTVGETPEAAKVTMQGWLNKWYATRPKVLNFEEGIAAPFPIQTTSLSFT